MYNEKELKLYEKLGIKAPESISHGTDLKDFNELARKLKPYSWKLTGNQLRGMTDMGELVQTIPSDRILVGTDEQGMPIFQKVRLQHQKTSEAPGQHQDQGGSS